MDRKDDFHVGSFDYAGDDPPPMFSVYHERDSAYVLIDANLVFVFQYSLDDLMLVVREDVNLLPSESVVMTDEQLRAIEDDGRLTIRRSNGGWVTRFIVGGVAFHTTFVGKECTRCFVGRCDYPEFLINLARSPHLPLMSYLCR